MASVQLFPLIVYKAGSTAYSNKEIKYFFNSKFRIPSFIDKIKLFFFYGFVINIYDFSPFDSYFSSLFFYLLFVYYYYYY